MSGREIPRGAVTPVLATFALMFTTLAVLTWIEALDFDPCENLFRKAGSPCLEPGWGGVLVGGFFVFLGLSIAWGGLRNGRREYGRWLEPLLFAWFGLGMSAVGAAAAFAQWSVGLS